VVESTKLMVRPGRAVGEPVFPGVRVVELQTKISEGNEMKEGGATPVHAALGGDPPLFTGPVTVAPSP